MKIKKSELNILIMLIGVLLVVISYFVVYSSFTEKTNGLRSDNATLQSEVDELQKLADNKEFYIEETSRMNDEIQTIMARYPGEIRVEDQVMYAYNLEVEHGIWVNSFSAEGTQLVQVATDTAVVETTDDEVTEDTGTDTETTSDAVVASGGLKDTVFLYSSPFTIGYKTTYRSAKDIIRQIVESDERMNITNISLAYDSETGCLNGTMDATTFTMSGTDYTYEELKTPGVSTGTADLFKSGAVLNLNQSAQSTSDTGEESESEEGIETESSDDAVTKSN